MPEGKPAGVRCMHLTDEFLCRLYGSPERPAVCLSLHVSEDWCGSFRFDAMARIALLEAMTA
jgi:hypothetical protein